MTKFSPELSLSYLILSMATAVCALCYPSTPLFEVHKVIFGGCFLAPGENVLPLIVLQWIQIQQRATAREKPESPQRMKKITVCFVEWSVMGVADTNTSLWLRAKHSSSVFLCLMRLASAVMCIVNENIKVCRDSALPWMCVFWKAIQ